MVQEKTYISIKAKPLISIITLNWNQTETTCQFLESTKKLTYKNYEILVCDMGSTVDPGPRIYNGNYPNTRLLRTDNNSKTTSGVNWAVKQASGDFILLINNHTEVTENLLEDLLAPLLADNVLGVTCPKIRSFYNKDVIEYAGYKPVNKVTGGNTIIGNKQKDKGQYDKRAYTHGAYTGAMMLRKSVIEKAGMLPQNFFIYFDDSDVSARIIKNGYKILYQPQAVVYNKSSMALGTHKTAMQVYYTTRNRIMYMRKNSNLAQFTSFMLFFTLFFTPYNILQFAVRRQFNHVKAFIKAIIWHIKTGKKSNGYN